MILLGGRVEGGEVGVLTSSPKTWDEQSLHFI